MKIAVLLINLGTPSACTPDAVREYLSEFLSDPYVITLPAWMRYFLVQKIILKTRLRKSTLAYQKIWTAGGSPLLVNMQHLQKNLQQQLGAEYEMIIGMRYGEPSIHTALETCREKRCDKIIIFPLFPQFSNAVTQSAIDAALNNIVEKNITQPITIIRDFHTQDFYLQALATHIKNNFNSNSEFLLFSYHSLPINHKGAEQYRRDCLETSAQLIHRLQLSSDQTLTTFQSRLGFTRWLSPYTDRSLKILRKQGIKNLVVACPSFVTDCVETLEEINIRLRARWMKLGGESFRCIECLNGESTWLRAMIELSDGSASARL